MFKKARKLPLRKRILYTVILSVLWIFIASTFTIQVQTNFLLSTLVIAGISSVFFPFTTEDTSSDD